MPTVEDRFWSKVDKSGTCWLWTEHLLANGYARFHVSGSYGYRERPYAHRWIYEVTYGPIPVGMEIDHLCRVRHCVNPTHLEAVTHAENVARTTGHNHGPYDVGTHCKHGHERTPENTGVNKYGARYCRPCARAVNQRISAKKRSERQ
jgi:hypothetical protein